MNNLKLTDQNYDTVMTQKNKGQNSAVWRYKTWNPTTLKRIIECTWYSEGYRTWKNERIELNESLKFINLELYKRANRQLKLNKTGRTPKIHTYFINNKLYCSCGELMRPKKVGNSHSYVCNKIILGDLNKQIKCRTGKTVQIERLENSCWLLIKNNIPEFKSHVAEKTSVQLKMESKININKILIENQATIIDDLYNQRKTIINVYAKFGGPTADFESAITNLDKEIEQQKKMIENFNFENEKLSISLLNLDLAEELQQNIVRIESEKKLIRLYINRLIKRVEFCGGLGGKYRNVLRIDWNDGINNDYPTYLFYYSKSRLLQKFYFITVDSDNNFMNIDWNIETVKFEITNTQIKEKIELDVDEMINIIDSEYYSFDSNTRKLIDKNPIFHNKSILNDNFKINLGISDLIIVTEFK